MTAVLLPVIKARFFDEDGEPLAGGKVYTYIAGTEDDKDTWVDADKSGTNTNPVILDANGEADIWLDGLYHIVVTDSADVQLYDTDDVSAVGMNTLATESVYGLVRFATDAQTLTGTSDTLATHPKGVKYATKINNYTAKTTMAQADVLALGDSAASFVNKKITLANFELQLQADLQEWIEGLIAAGGGGGSVQTSGMLVDRAFDSNNSTGNISGYTAIPNDNTIPQSTEGTEILTVTITPKKTTNVFRCYLNVIGGGPFSASGICAALFKTGSTDAVFAAPHATYNPTIVGITEFTPGVLTPITVSVRVGRANGGDFTLNNTNPGNGTLGGVVQSVLVVDELDPFATGGGDYVLLGSGTIDMASPDTIDLRDFADNDTWDSLVIETRNWSSPSTSNNAITVRFLNQGVVYSTSTYADSGVGGFAGSIAVVNNDAFVTIANGTGIAAALTSGAGNMVLTNFMNTDTTVSAALVNQLSLYNDTGVGAPQTCFFSGNGSVSQTGDTWDGLEFTSTAAYTFDFDVFGIRKG